MESENRAIRGIESYGDAFKGKVKQLRAATYLISAVLSFL